MNWYYTIAGGHTHVRVFMNRGKCGDLVFRNEEFEQVKRHHEGVKVADKKLGFPDVTIPGSITFIEDQPPIE